MPTTAAEIMDRNFLYASQGDSLVTLLHEMEHRGLGTAPVLDIDGRPSVAFLAAGLSETHITLDANRRF